jgi:hypothetical protein
MIERKLFADKQHSVACSLNGCHSFDRILSLYPNAVVEILHCVQNDNAFCHSEAKPKNLKRNDLTKNNHRDSSRSLSSSEAKGSE